MSHDACTGDVVDDRTSRVIDGWFVLRAPLNGPLQACSRAGELGLRVVIIDSGLPECVVQTIVDELEAAARGDFDEAPHVPRPRPQLTLVR